MLQALDQACVPLQHGSQSIPPLLGCVARGPGRLVAGQLGSESLGSDKTCVHGAVPPRDCQEHGPSPAGSTGYFEYPELEGTP